MTLIKKILYLSTLLISVQKIYSQDTPDIRIMVGDNHKFAYVINENNKWVNLSGFDYDDARDFQPNGVAWVRYNGKCAIINRKFKLVSDLYNNMSIWVGEKLIAVEKDGLYGFINDQGKEIVPLEYKAIHFIVQDKQFVSVSKDQKWALLDLNNKPVIGFKYNSPVKVDAGYVSTSNDSGRYGVMKLNETIVVPFIYDQIKMPGIKNRFIAKTSQSVVLLNERNKQLFTCKDCDLYAVGYLSTFIVEKENKKGLVDQNGKVIAAPKYDKFLDWKSGYIVYEINKMQGLLDSSGKDVLDRTYSSVELLNNNEVLVFNGEHYQKITLKAK